MINTRQADQIIGRNLVPFGKELIRLQKAGGRVLRETITADRDFPPFDRSLMDGIGIDFSDYKNGRNSFLIQGIQAAGKPTIKKLHPAECVEIMTGAQIPTGCDCVIPIEDVRISHKVASINLRTKLNRWQNIRRKGSDQKKGDVLLHAGTHLNAVGLSIAAAVGKERLSVSVKPRVTIVSTGNEIVKVKRSIKPWQSRCSNQVFLETALGSSGMFTVKSFHLRDDPSEMIRILKKVLHQSDIVVLSGGVSMGKFDFVPKVLQQLGVTLLFHKVSQKPGKPFWFGKCGEGKVVFALPGNPVSTQIGAYRYVLPHLMTALGLNVKKHWVAINKQKYERAGMTLFLPVKVGYNKNKLPLAVPISFSGSGDLAALARSDGFVDIVPSIKKRDVISKVPFYRW